MSGPELLVTAGALMAAALLPIMNPATSAALFLGLCGAMPSGRRAAEARKIGLYVFATLVVAWFAGAATLAAFGVSLTGLRLAGGLIVAYIGFRMLFPPPQGSVQAPPLDASPASSRR